MKTNGNAFRKTIKFRTFPKDDEISMLKKNALLYILCLLICLNFYPQQKFVLSGYVRDAASGEALVGAGILVKNLGIGVSANEYGYFALTLPAGTHTIRISYVGYKDKTEVIQLNTNILHNFLLSEQGTNLQEVEIVSEKLNENITSKELSTVKLDMRQINKIPALLGEVDIIRSIQLLPGITTVGEGATGYNARGGNVDQNLILLDEAPVFNSSHLFGFFSVFNPDAVKDVKLVKGGISAQYGGRVSSILDIRMKEGNNQRMEVGGGVGTIFSRLSVEAPIVKDKASFILSGRRSYLDILARPFLRKNESLKNAKFFFYDATVKVNWKTDEKNTFYLSGYFGRDVFGAGFGFDWGNSTTTFRWNHLWSNKLFMNLTAFFSNYSYKLSFSQENSNQKFDWASNIKNYSIKNDYTYFLNSRNTLRFGYQAIYYDFLPGDAVALTNNTLINIKLKKRYGLEHAGYFSDEIKFNSSLSGEMGVRVSYYQYLGPGTRYVFRDTMENTVRPLDRKIRVASFRIIQDYLVPEPRISLNYLLSEINSIKFGYNRMAQYLQLVSNTAASTPLDVYALSTNNIRPLVADQVSAGYFHNFFSNAVEASAEVYYKWLTNQLDYIDNADLFLNEELEGQLLMAKGRAWGMEWFIRKRTGRWTGWISYTFSRTRRLARGISNNTWFNSKYDRPHCLNLVLNYELSRRWSISSNFVFLSGTPSTFPDSRLEIQGYSVPYNSSGFRNNYRIPPYHRLDLGATYQFRKNDVKKFKQNLVISIYNVYARRNAYSVYFSRKDGINQAIRFSVVATVVPAITYNFNF